MRSPSAAPSPDDTGPPLLQRIVSAGQLRYVIICTWAVVLATEVRVEWVAAWLAVTLATGLGRGAFEEHLRRRGAKKGRVAANQGFDLIIMDVNMPVMDGLLATGHIRENAGPNRETAIVILSASARGEDHQRGLDAGGDAYLDKPVDFGALMEVLVLAGGGRRAFQEAAAAAGHDSLSDVA